MPRSVSRLQAYFETLKSKASCTKCSLRPRQRSPFCAASPTTSGSLRGGLENENARVRRQSRACGTSRLRAGRARLARLGSGGTTRGGTLGRSCIGQESPYYREGKLRRSSTIAEKPLLLVIFVLGLVVDGLFGDQARLRIADPLLRRRLGLVYLSEQDEARYELRNATERKKACATAPCTSPRRAPLSACPRSRRSGPPTSSTQSSAAASRRRGGGSVRPGWSARGGQPTRGSGRRAAGGGRGGRPSRDALGR